MHALVVFESMYGNTKEIAEAVAEGLSTRMPVELAEVAVAPMVVGEDVALLVVGGPTHAHGMSKPDTRRSAAERAAAERGTGSPTFGLREWLAGLGNAPAHVVAAAFDTRIRGPRLLWGSAARAAETQLRHAGARVVIPAESFFVGGPLGSVYDALVDGERERARRWGERLAAELPV
jgi:hypothetical protein